MQIRNQDQFYSRKAFKNHQNHSNIEEMSVKLPNDIHILAKGQTTDVAETVKNRDVRWRSLRKEGPVSLREPTEGLKGHTTVQ